MKKQELKDIPTEVLWAFQIQLCGQPVGQKIYEEVKSVIDKYPQYFQWEHKYKSIPQEVHDAFLKERYPELEEPIDFSKSSMQGIMANLGSQEPIRTLLSKNEFEEIFKNIYKKLEEKEKEKNEELKRVKKIWDKHYSKFGLEFR